MGKRLSGQRRLLAASLLLIFGGWLPWLYTGVGIISGARGAGLWVFRNRDRQRDGEAAWYLHGMFG